MGRVSKLLKKIDLRAKTKFPIFSTHQPLEHLCPQRSTLEGSSIC